MDLNDFIDKNRATIDEFLGPNQESYIMISLKGRLSKEIGRDEAFKYFEHWQRLGYTAQQTNVQIRLVLEAITQRGEDVKSITPKDKILYLKIMKEEFKG